MSLKDDKSRRKFLNAFKLRGRKLQIKIQTLIDFGTEDVLDPSIGFVSVWEGTRYLELFSNSNS